MNFVLWLLKRMKRKIFGGEWGWLYKYREFIKEEMPLAILVTVLLGAVWTIIVGAICAGLIDDMQILRPTMKFVISCPPLFFIYNWVYGLYQIYDTERMRVWEELKR